MKKILIFSLIALLCSCQQEPQVVETPIEIKDITIENLADLLPLTTGQSRTKAIFYNKEGTEIIFDFAMEKKTVQKIIGSESYMTEEISAQYRNESIPSFYLSFVGFGNYTSLEKAPTLGILASIRQTVHPLSTMLTIDETGKPIIAMFYNKKQLLDTEFTNVYSNFISDEYTAFSELYYAPEFGIVGFKDQQDDLYVFREFQD